MSKPIKPGTDNQPKGTYQEVGPKGGAVNRPRVVHIDKGDRLPPTQKPGNKWVKKIVLLGRLLRDGLFNFPEAKTPT
jgi:hypothetical protein